MAAFLSAQDFAPSDDGYSAWNIMEASPLEVEYHWLFTIVHCIDVPDSRRLVDVCYGSIDDVAALAVDEQGYDAQVRLVLYKEAGAWDAECGFVGAVFASHQRCGYAVCDAIGDA